MTWGFYWRAPLSVDGPLFYRPAQPFLPAASRPGSCPVPARAGCRGPWPAASISSSFLTAHVLPHIRQRHRLRSCRALLRQGDGGSRDREALVRPCSSLGWLAKCGQGASVLRHLPSARPASAPPRQWPDGRLRGQGPRVGAPGPCGCVGEWGYMRRCAWPASGISSKLLWRVLQRPGREQVVRCLPCSRSLSLRCMPIEAVAQRRRVALRPIRPSAPTSASGGGR